MDVVVTDERGALADDCALHTAFVGAAVKVDAQRNPLADAYRFVRKQVMARCAPHVLRARGAVDGDTAVHIAVSKARDHWSIAPVADLLRERACDIDFVLENTIGENMIDLVCAKPINQPTDWDGAKRQRVSALLSVLQWRSRAALFAVVRSGCVVGSDCALCDD